MILNKGFRQFLVKTGIFLGLFVLISFVIGQRIVASSLLYGFGLFVYGGMGKILLFSIFGFVLLYRDRLLELKYYKYEKGNLVFLLISLITTIAFYILELNIERFSPTVESIILVHILFLSIFVFLGMGIFGLNFIRYFFGKFKKELGYFLIFGVVVYFLMHQVWKLWPVLSLVVTKISAYLLGLIGDVVLIDRYSISFNGFAAQIGEACSGVYSIFIFTALYLFAVILDWGKLDKKRVVLVFVPAVVGAFLVNIFRVFLLFVVGAFFSRAVAVGLYHSYVGMIFFLIYFGVFWSLSYKWMKK
ncbi:exosortase/archaeosortase family protein [Candidatus Pacearchaeota archaeon]|nr:exosortase/archaeosortase family protein [Candidatus Pacearchaeota archaeon]